MGKAKRIVNTIGIACFVVFIFAVGGLTFRGFFREAISQAQTVYADTGSFSSVITNTNNLWKVSIFKRETFVTADALVNYAVNRSVKNPQVISGKKGWLFYSATEDGQPLEDYQGTNFYTIDEQEAAAVNIQSMKDELAAAGIDFTLFTPPNKEKVYEELMPDRIERQSELSRTDILIEYLRSNTDARIVDPKYALIDGKDDAQLYYQYDTHWTKLGAYVALQELYKAWGVESVPLSERTIETVELPYEGSTLSDLARLAGIRRFIRDKEVYNIEGGIEPGPDFGTEQESGFSTVENPNAPIDESVMLIGDSFRTSLVPELARMYKTVYVIDYYNYKTGMYKEYMPDHLIFECVERYSPRILDLRI